MVELLLAVSFAVGVSAMCSLFEAVLYSVPYSYLDILSRGGSRAGELFTKMRQNVERPISAILTLNTVANTFGAAVAGAAASVVFGKEWLGLFSAVFTLSILLFSEIIPKTLGVRYAKGLARVVAWPLYLMQWVLLPIGVATTRLTRLLGASGPTAGVSAEEIQVMARMGRSSGALRGFEETVIRNILVIRKTRARDIMTPRTVLFSLPKDLTLGEVRSKSPMWPWPHSRVPVYDADADQIVGIVQRRNVLAALADDRDEEKLSALMRPVYIVPDTVSADRLLHDFIERREHLFVVVDEYGGIAGVVTLEDVFEEIIGQEIVDESDWAEDMQSVAHKKRKKILQRRPPE